MWTCGRLRSIIDNSVLTYGVLTQIKSNLGLTVIKVGSKVGEHGLGSESLWERRVYPWSDISSSSSFDRDCWICKALKGHVLQ